MADESLQEKRDKYESAIVGEIGRLASAVSALSGRVEDMRISLAQVNLAELKADVRKINDVLLRYDLQALTSKVEAHDKYDFKEMKEVQERHDKQITRAVAILVFIQIVFGMVLAILKFFGK